MSTKLTLTIIIIFVALVLLRLRKIKKTEEKYKKVFDLVFNEATPKPSYESGFTHGFPFFVIKYPSKEELDKARKEGTTKLFITEIGNLCEHFGNKANPFDPNQAILFTYEGQFDKS